MLSLRATLILTLLKYRHWLRFQFRRPVVTKETSIADLRARADRGAARFGGKLDGLRHEPVQAATVAAEWLTPANRSGDGVLLYCHGGGYVLGSMNSHRGVVAKFAKACGTAALHFDYRLAPEHPYPAARDDALAVYRWLLQQGHNPSRIALIGDSAGGGLVLALLLALKQAQLPMPAAAVTMSAWTDLSCSAPSYALPDPLAPAGSWQVYSDYYAGDHDKRDPGLSPLFGDLSGLPPLLMCVGAAESMRDDTLLFADKARAAGVNVEVLLGAGMVHCYPVMAPMFPEATDAFNHIVQFIQVKIMARNRGS